MDQKILAYSFWGVPFGWNRVNYKLPGNNACSVNSISSLDVLLDLYKDSQIDILLMFQESLLAYKHCNYGFCRLHKIDNLNNYMDLLSRLKREIYNLIKIHTVNLKEENISLGFGPSIGRFPYASDNGISGVGVWKYASDIDNKVSPYNYFLAISIVYVLRHMLEYGEPDNEGLLEVLLDISHGLNYATLAFHNAVILSARLFSVLTGKEVIVRIYNSEPYVSGAKELYVWPSYTYRVSPTSAAGFLVYELLRVHPANYSKVVREPVLLLKNDKEFKSRFYTGRIKKVVEPIAKFLFESMPGGLVYMVAASLFFGAPLLFAQTGEWLLDLKNPISIVKRFLEDLEKFYWSNDVRLIDRRDSETIIAYNIVLDLDRLISLLAGLALTGYVKNNYSKIFPGRNANLETRLLELYSGSRDKGENEYPEPVYNAVCLTVEELEKLLAYISSPSKGIVVQEISHLKTLQSISKPLLLKEIRKKTKCTTSSNNKKKTSPGDLRIFQAHAGFNEDIIGIIPLKDNVCFYYVQVKSHEGKTTEQFLSKISKDLLINLYNEHHKPHL